MKISDFELERYFAKYEFSIKHKLCASDCEGLSQKELLSMADKESLDLWNNLKLGYTESQGNPILRKEISKLYSNVAPEDVLVLTPEEGIFVAMNILLEKGDHVIVTFPGYQSLYEIANSLGCEVTKWIPDSKNNWELNLDFLKKSIKSNTKLIVTNFPHNPTGYLPTREKFLGILDIAKKNGLYVFSDEMYRCLEYDAKDTLPSACEVYDKAVILFGMSKTFALAGLRIGWLITKDRNLFKSLSSFKDYTTICCSAPSEILSIIAIRNKDKIIKRNLRIIKENLILFDEFVLEHKDWFSWVRPNAGSIAFPELKKGKVDEFCLDLMERANVLLLPSSVYRYEGNNFRIGFGRADFQEALKGLDDFLITAKATR